MYREVKFSELSKELLVQLQKGAFLTVKQGDRVNTMTIAWGSLGYIWNKPIFTSLVRYSRYTYGLIDNAADFTVSFPLKGQLKKELAVCGSKSGRDIDKIKECKLSLKKSDIVKSPSIDGCDLYLECRIVYKQGMDKNLLDDNIKNAVYSDNDYHVMYFGEIVKAYIKED